MLSGRYWKWVSSIRWINRIPNASTHSTKKIEIELLRSSSAELFSGKTGSPAVTASSLDVGVVVLVTGGAVELMALVVALGASEELLKMLKCSVLISSPPLVAFGTIVEVAGFEDEVAGVELDVDCDFAEDGWVVIVPLGLVALGLVALVLVTLLLVALDKGNAAVLFGSDA